MLLELFVKRSYLLHRVEHNCIWLSTTWKPLFDFTESRGLQVGGG